MKLRWDNQHVRWGVTAFLVIAASMLFYYGVFHMKTLITGIQTFLGILTPIIYGVVIAFLLTPVLYYDGSAGIDPKRYGLDLQFSLLCEGYPEVAAVLY